MQWSWLEFVTMGLITHLAGLKLGAPEAHCITSNVEFRSKTKMLRALGALHRPSEAWFERLETLLNKIESELSSRRNRVVHDVWLPPHGNIEHATRTHSRTRIAKEQSHTPKNLTLQEVVTVDEAAVIELHNDILEAINELLALSKEVPDWPLP